MKVKRVERILALIQVLKENTDYNHHLKLHDITLNINEKFDFKTNFTPHLIHRDLLELVKSEFINVVVEKGGDGLPNYYYYDSHIFKEQQLRLMMDAVVSAKVITAKEKGKIIEKIKELTSKQSAEDLENQIHINDNASGTHENVHFYISNLHYAIQHQRKIAYMYGRYNTKKEFVLSKDGKKRQFKPYALHWNNDNYYLIGKNDKDKTIHLRVDRLRRVDILQESFIRDHNFNVTKYTEKLFHMYSGEVKFLKVEFDEHLINVIIDRFGLEVDIEEIEGGKKFILRTEAAISDGLFRWLLTWGSDAKVIDPPELAQRIKEEGRKMFENYT